MGNGTKKRPVSSYVLSAFLVHSKCTKFNFTQGSAQVGSSVLLKLITLVSMEEKWIQMMVEEVEEDTIEHNNSNNNKYWQPYNNTQEIH